MTLTPVLYSQVRNLPWITNQSGNAVSNYKDLKALMLALDEKKYQKFVKIGKRKKIELELQLFRNYRFLMRK